MPSSPFDVGLDTKDGYLTADFFKSLQLDPDVIFDVGVSRGTPWLYKAFPEKKFLLIDPLPEFEDKLHTTPEHYECLNLGLGSTPGTLTLDLRGPRSSVHEWKKNTNHTSHGTVDVQITTLDDLIEKHAATQSIGLKIDTEGHEVEVIKGLDTYSSNIQFLVCECSVRQRFEDGYRFSDLISIAARKGFEFYNFLSPQKPRPLHYDCIFFRADDERFSLGDI